MKGVKTILETVLIEDGWNMLCVICKDGTTYVMIEVGVYMNRDQFIQKMMYCNDDNFINKRFEMFDKLDAYYLEIKDK